MPNKVRTRPYRRRRPIYSWRARLCLGLMLLWPLICPIPSQAANPAPEVRWELAGTVGFKWLGCTGSTGAKVCSFQTVLPLGPEDASLGRLELALYGGKQRARWVYNLSDTGLAIKPGVFGVCPTGLDRKQAIAQVVPLARTAVGPPPAGMVRLNTAKAERMCGFLQITWKMAPGKGAIGSYDLSLWPAARGVEARSGRVLARLRVGPDGGIAAPKLVGAIDVAAWPRAAFAAETCRSLQRAVDDLAGNHWQRALRGVEQLYSPQGGPAGAAAAELLKDAAMEMALRGGDIKVGPHTYSLRGLTALFSRRLLLSPDYLQWAVLVDGDLPLPRFLYLALRAARPEGTTRNMPGLDLKHAMASPDPWLASAAMFAARKGLGRLDPQAVVDRWQSGAAWDRECSRQGVLFLAGLSKEELKRLSIKGPRVKKALSWLRPVKPGRCLVQDLYMRPDNSLSLVKEHPTSLWLRGWRQARPGEKTTTQITRAHQDAPTVVKSGVRINGVKIPQAARVHGAFYAPPGEYELTAIIDLSRGRHMTASPPGFHGSSPSFQCPAGVFVRTVVVLRGNI